MQTYQEKGFEDLIGEQLLARGWQKSPAEGYDKARAKIVAGWLGETVYRRLRERDTVGAVKL